MPISFAEPLELQCPRCGRPFRTETWVVVDGDERPDLVARILDGTLHDTICPGCQQSGQVPAPVLYHDRRRERVLLAVPAGMAEEEWRAAGQSLLWMLIGGLPETERGPYLGELQAEAGLDGIASVIRAEDLAGSGPPVEDDEVPPLVGAIQALLGASGAGELQQVLQQHPILLDPQAITILRELSHEAFKQGESDAGRGFSGAADILVDLRDVQRPATRHAPAGRTPASTPVPIVPSDDPIEELAFALLRSHSGETLAATVDEYPQLLEAETSRELAGWAERARSEGKPRIADGIDERLEALRMMRERFERERPVFDAVQALLEADSGDEVEAVLVEYDALFTDEADTVLGRLAEGTDRELAELARERRTFLQRVRAVLDGQENDENPSA